MPTREGADALLSYTWAFPICPYRVTIDLSVIAAFQHDLTEAGARQQGLLFGQTHSGLTEIDGRKSLPAFSRDEFAAALESARREVVGYYSIRDGSAFILAPDEMNVAKDLFHKPGSVVLLIERRTGGPAEGTFLFWRGDSFVHNLPSPFPIDPALLPGVENSALAGSARPYEFSPEPPMPDQIAMVEPAPAKNELSTLGLVVAILTAGLVLWGGLRLRPEAPSQSQAAVPASARAGAPIAAPVRSDLEITWDPKSILTAKAGLLKIEDGGINHQMSLNPDELRFGRVLYSPASDNIKVAMKALDINGSIVEIAASTRPASLAPIVPVARIPDATPVAPAEPALPKPDQKAGAGRFLVSVPVPPKTVDARPPLRSFTLPTGRHAAASAPVVLDPPPADPPAIASAAVPLVPSLHGSIPAPTPPAATTLPAPAHVAASTGRLIWTGTLQRRGVVELEGHSATLGALSGALPGVPVALTISPAEFDEDGLIVYTTDANRNNRTEPPSARNGWNKVRFAWDPERVRQIVVLETPNPSNHFSRLSLRNDSRRCSMLLIDWATR